MPHLIVASLLFAASFGLISRHLSGVDPSFIACVRMAFSLALFVPFFRKFAVGSGTRGLRLLGVSRGSDRAG